MSDRLGGELSSAVHSAFGKPISGPAVDDVNRYNYAGVINETAPDRRFDRAVRGWIRIGTSGNPGTEFRTFVGAAMRAA